MKKKTIAIIITVAIVALVATLLIVNGLKVSSVKKLIAKEYALQLESEGITSYSVEDVLLESGGDGTYDGWIIYKVDGTNYRVNVRAAKEGEVYTWHTTSSALLDTMGQHN